MKQNYELPIVKIILEDECDVICTSEGMTLNPDPLQPGEGGSTEWGL